MQHSLIRSIRHLNTWDAQKRSGAFTQPLLEFTTSNIQLNSTHALTKSKPHYLMASFSTNNAYLFVPALLQVVVIFPKWGESPENQPQEYLGRRCLAENSLGCTTVSWALVHSIQYVYTTLVYVYIYIYTHMFMYIHIHLSLYLSLSTYIYIHLCMIYIYTHTV